MAKYKIIRNKWDKRKNRRIEFMSEKGKESGYSLPDNRHKFP